MAKNKTAVIAKPVSKTGQLYQQRACVALPILVHQAKAGTSIYYSELAEEMGLRNPRIFNFILGSIGTSLEQLSETWNEEIPRLQAIVISKGKGMPGSGFAESLPNAADFQRATPKQQQAMIDVMLSDVYAYTRWDDVLAALRLSPISTAPVVDEAFHGGSGESPEHEALKRWAASSPQSFGLPANSEKGSMEAPLPSGDVMDVLYRDALRWTGVEVKSHLSSDQDLSRGIFQVVKYRAVVEAWARLEQRPVTVSVHLTVGRPLSAQLQRAAHALHVPVVHGPPI